MLVDHVIAAPFNVLAMAREIIDRCGLPDLPYGCYCGLGNHGTHKKPGSTLLHI